MRPRQIAPVALVLALVVAGFVVARLLTEQDARRDSEHSAELAAAQIRGRIAEAGSLAESLRQFMLDASGTGVTSAEFAQNALRWLSPSGFPAAAWVERVPDSRRAAYERRIGQRIVTADESRSVVPSRSRYVPTTLVSGFDPMHLPGLDLGGERGMIPALARATRRDGVVATPVAPRRGGPSGLFLVAPAPNLVDEVLRPGYVVVFVPAITLRAAAKETSTTQIASSGASAEDRARGKTVSNSFTAAGQRFDVLVPEEAVGGVAALAPWIILVAGLCLAGLAAALGVSRARRAKAQDELDRIFKLSPDLIAVADFKGHFTRVNPAVEHVLGYTPQEFVETPFLDLVHPEDREKTAAEAAAAGEAKTTLSFENRYVHKDGSARVLEWTSTPVVEDGLMYGMARDVTERREAEAEVERLAEEQAALRRVATLVAQAAPLSEVFTAVTREAGTLLDADFAGLARFDSGTVVTVAVWAAEEPHPSVPESWQMEPGDAATTVAERGDAVRWDDWTDVPGPIAEFIREIGIGSTVGCPIMVGGELWGALAVHSKADAPLRPDAERRVTQFNDLVATAIGNAHARTEVARLAEEQAALRRVATLVAEEQSRAEVFAKVAEEAANVLEKVECALLRDSGDGSATVVAAQGADMSARFPVGTQLPTEGDGVLASALREGWPQRIEHRSAGGATAEAARDLGISSAVASPIVAREGIWGAIVAARFDGGSCPPDTETRLAQFADLVATAIANADARAQVERLADEQAALRRVAMLCAAGASPTAVLDAVAAEVEALLGADQVALNRFEPGDEIIVLAHRGLDVERTPVGSRVSIAGESATASVRRTGRPARMEGYESAEGAIAEIARDTGLRSSVSAPISVEGRLWGLITASWKTDEPPPPETEERMVKFAELLDTAIANADSRDQLKASRARLVTAGDEARRRVVRDLHDGAQQRLVHTIVTLKLAQHALRQQDENAEALLGEALQNAEQGNAELRELAHGILPALLTRGGLRAGVDSLVARLDLPVRVQVSSERFPVELEASAYFIVAEALTNVMKHAHAARAAVTASVADGVLQVEVRDDGVGGADPSGHGLVGMADRVSALGGQLRVDSPGDGGTLVSATLPLSTDGAGSSSGGLVR